MKEKIYIIFKNNEEEYDDYSDWITEIYKDKEKAEKRFVELVKTNQYKKDRTIRKVKYNEDIGAYRIEEHEIENETNEVIDTNVSDIEEDIKKQKESLRNWLAMHVLIKENSYMRFNYEDCWNLYKFVENALIKSDDYKRVLKENEELKFEKRSRIIGKYGDTEIHDLINRTLSNDYILKQKIKDKIEELNKVYNAEELEDILWRKNYTITELVQYVLQEILEESEDSKKWRRLKEY